MAKLVMESLFESAAEEFHINSRFRSTLLNCFFQLSNFFFYNLLWILDGWLSEETRLDWRERIPAWANIEHPRQRSLTNSSSQKLVQYASLIFLLYHRPPQQKTITYHCFASITDWDIFIRETQTAAFGCFGLTIITWKPQIPFINTALLSGHIKHQVRCPLVSSLPGRGGIGGVEGSERLRREEFEFLHQKSQCICGLVEI